MPSKTVIKQAEKAIAKGLGLELAKDLTLVLGVGLTAGVALIAATDKIMKKAFPEKDEKRLQKVKEKENAEREIIIKELKAQAEAELEEASEAVRKSLNEKRSDDVMEELRKLIDEYEEEPEV